MSPIFEKRHSNLLKEMDYLYQKVISSFSIEGRIAYCESLIHRTKDDVTNSKCPIKKRKLKKLLKAAQKELRQLA